MINNHAYEVMKEFLKDYNKTIYGRELIGKVNLSVKGISLLLNKLEDEKVLVSMKQGGIKYFSLNKKNPSIKKYIVITEIMYSIKFLEGKIKIRHIFEKLINLGQIVCIFGSYARETQKKDSDLDLFVVGNFNKEQIKKIKEINNIYNLKINVKNITKSNFIKAIKENNLLIKEILVNHVILSGYDGFVKGVINQIW